MNLYHELYEQNLGHYWSGEPFDVERFFWNLFHDKCVMIARQILEEL